MTKIDNPMTENMEAIKARHATIREAAIGRFAMRIPLATLWIVLIINFIFVMANIPTTQENIAFFTGMQAGMLFIAAISMLFSFLAMYRLKP